MHHDSRAELTLILEHRAHMHLALGLHVKIA